VDRRSGNITTIFKKSSRLDTGNYRVSITCICCKIIEFIIRDYITTHLINNKLFINKQFGFIKGRSTILQLLKVMDIWTETLESGSRIDVNYTDLKKDCDNVPHKRLISKLLLLFIIRSYTKYRIQHENKQTKYFYIHIKLI